MHPTYQAGWFRKFSSLGLAAQAGWHLGTAVKPELSIGGPAAKSPTFKFSTFEVDPVSRFRVCRWLNEFDTPFFALFRRGLFNSLDRERSADIVFTYAKDHSETFHSPHAGRFEIALDENSKESIERIYVRPSCAHHSDKKFVSHLFYWYIIHKPRNDGPRTCFLSKVYLLHHLFSLGLRKPNLRAYLYVKTICIRVLHNCTCIRRRRRVTVYQA